jgi:hypothetical protein
MLPPSSDGVTPDAAAEYEVTIGSFGPGGGAGGAGAGGGAGVLAGGGSCGEFDESITLLPESETVSGPPPQAARLAASAATSCRRIDTSITENSCPHAQCGVGEDRTGGIAGEAAMLQAIACNETVRTRASAAAADTASAGTPPRSTSAANSRHRGGSERPRAAQ